MEKDKFYLIKVINRNKNIEGFIFDSAEGIKVVVGGITAQLTQFETAEAANEFIRKNKLNGGGMKAIVLSNKDVIKQQHKGLVAADIILFYITNGNGERFFHDSKTNDYYFANKDVGFCCWNSKADCEQTIEHLKLHYPAETFVIGQIENPSKLN